MQNPLIFRHFYLAIVALVLVNSCKNDGCNDPVAFNYDPEGTEEASCIYEPKQIELTGEALYGSQELVLNQSYETEDGRQIKFTYYGMYLSNISFLEEDEAEYQVWNEQDVMLFKDDRKTMNAIYLNKSAITSMRFDIGVDTAIYNQDPTTSDRITEDSPLAIQIPSMYWGWAGGYRFISIEGEVDLSAAKDGSDMREFAFHCGLPANLKSLELDASALQPSMQELNIVVSADLQKMLDGIDFTTTELIIHDGMNPTTVQIMNNAPEAFEIR